SAPGGGRLPERPAGEMCLAGEEDEEGRVDRPCRRQRPGGADSPGEHARRPGGGPGTQSPRPQFHAPEVDLLPLAETVRNLLRREGLEWKRSPALLPRCLPRRSTVSWGR